MVESSTSGPSQICVVQNRNDEDRRTDLLVARRRRRAEASLLHGVADYAGSKRLFGSIDVARYPEIAKDMTWTWACGRCSCLRICCFGMGTPALEIAVLRPERRYKSRAHALHARVHGVLLPAQRRPEAARRLEKIEKNRVGASRRRRPWWSRRRGGPNPAGAAAEVDRA